jgi:predicted NBD/HSP70 family sugar kinase
VIHVTIQDVAALLGGSGTLYASVRGIPMLSNFLKNQVRLVRERDDAVEARDAALLQAKTATDAAEAFELAASGWKAALEQIGREVEALRAAVAQARAEVAQSRQEVHATRELLAQSINYITAIHTFMRVGGNPPEMPSALRSEIDAILENKEIADLHAPLSSKTKYQENS